MLNGVTYKHKTHFQETTDNLSTNHLRLPSNRDKSFLHKVLMP